MYPIMIKGLICTHYVILWLNTYSSYTISFTQIIYVTEWKQTLKKIDDSDARIYIMVRDNWSNSDLDPTSQHLNGCEIKH